MTNKSRTLRKAGAVVLSLAMAFSVAGVAPSADAAAKKPALSAKKGTITVGKTKAVKVKNTTAKKVKKLVVSSNNKKVATVTKKSKVKFIVTGKKAGTAKITAKVTLKKAVAKKKVYTLKYTATVKAAATPTTAPVEPTATPEVEDHSAEVKIIDEYGLQSDGTGIVTDSLRVTFGADFGVPKAITWYRDGAVLTSVTSETGVDNNLTHFVTAADGVGVYYAAVIDANGKSHKTNEITISAKEDKAVIESFTIEDDYTDGSDITYAADDKTAVATVVMNKNFQGTFRIYKKTDTKYATVADTMNTSAGTAAGITDSASDAGDTANAGDSILVTSAGTNYNLLQKKAGSGMAYIGRDGKVTYKWIVDGGLTRGTEYVVVFDQTSVVEDNIGSGTENVFATAVAAPYLTAPAKAEITKAAKNAPVEITLMDADGKTLTYMGMQTAVAGITKVGAKTDSAIYSAAKSGVEAAKANKHAATLGVAGSLKAGVWTSDVSVSGTDAFWFANLIFNKGIYGADEITLRTADKQVAYDAATALTISYDTKAPKDIKVTFGNLRADSTVYLVALLDADGANSTTDTATVSDEIPSEAFARVYADKNVAIASADVTAGTGDYTFTGAIKGITTGDGASTHAAKNGNSYIAVIIPKDEVNYSPTYTGQDAASGDAGAGWQTAAPAAIAAGGIVDIKATLVSYKVAGKGEFTGEAASYANGAAFKAADDTALLGVDQFGNDLTGTAFAEVVNALDMTCVNPTVATTPGTATTITTAASSNGGVNYYGIITIAAGGATVNKGEAWSIKLSTGQTLTATATSNNGTAKTSATWKVALS